MENQSSFDLYADKPMIKAEEMLTYSKPLVKRSSSPPPRPGTKKRIFHHFVFDRVHLYPPPRNTPKPPHQPHLLDARFIATSIWPFPQYPPLCALTRLPSFETEKDLAAFHNKMADHSPTLLKWRCRSCKCVHVWTSSPTATDTGGNWTSGADKPPNVILMEFLHPKNEPIFRFIPKETKNMEEGKNPK